MPSCQIIPSSLDPNERENPKSRAEIRLYDAFSQHLSSDFIVYYSMWWFNTLEPNIRQQDGEADFIILHKDLGVIFIEVKGGLITRNKDGRWFSNQHQIKDPIMQSRNCLYQFRRKFQKRYTERFGKRNLISPHFAHFAFFPDSFKPLDQDLGEGLEIDQFGFQEDMNNISKKIYDFFFYRPTGKEINEFDSLGEQGLEIFEDMFHKDLDFTPSLKQQIGVNSYEVKKLTEEQENFNDQFSDWNRLWVEGPAGSGKTTLAVNKMIDSAEKGVQKAVYLCRNKILAFHIQGLIEERIPDEYFYISNTFDKFSFDLSGIEYFGDRETIIKKAIENVGRDDIYDLVIIDEAQDFEENWWNLIKKIISKKSILWIFGDSNQRIWETKEPQISGIDNSVKLFDVLRNTQEIASLGNNFYEGRGRGLNLMGPIGPKVVLLNTSDFKSSLSNKIKSLHNYEGLRSSQIAILHQKNLSKSVAYELLNNANDLEVSLSDDINLWQENILVSSVFKFKGMESDVILFLIEDAKSITDEELYVGITRARSLLVIICKNDEIERAKKRLEIFS